MAMVPVSEVAAELSKALKPTIVLKSVITGRPKMELENLQMPNLITFLALFPRNTLGLEVHLLNQATPP